MYDLGGNVFKEKIKALKIGTDLGFYQGIIPSDPGKIRKLVYFPDKEGKTRVVAEMDYFSQSVLKPLHLYLAKVLKKIPQDMTFSQGSFRNSLKERE